MANIATFSALNEKVLRLKREETLETEGIAFMKLGLQTILKITDDEIEEALTDGPMDGEVDAIYVDNRVVHIFTFKYTSDFEQSKKNFPENELDQYILTIDHIISGSLDEKTINPAVWEKYEEIKDLSSHGRVDFKVYVVSNKAKPVPHAMRKMDNALSRFRILQKPIYLDQEDLVTILLQNRFKKVDGSVTFVDTQHFEKSNGEIRTVIGVIAASDLIKLIESREKAKVIDEDVFNENVRVYKPNHRVNKAIIESCKSKDNYQFFYLNNGITILCEECNYKPNTKSPFVEINNFQIINGGQTSHSIFEVSKTNPAKITNVEILLRICIVKPGHPISELISETSNNQIPIGSRDLHSNDLIQRKLEEEFDSLGYYYERKPNQHADKPRSKVLNNELLGQLFMAYHHDMPSEAKNNKTLIFGNMYDLIFDEKCINAKELLRLYKIYLPLLEQKKEIQKKKRRKEKVNEKEAFISRATFHLMNVIKFIINKRIDAIKKNTKDKAKIKAEINSIYSKDIDKITGEAIQLIHEVVKEQIKIRRNLYTHDKFFKEIPTNQLIQSYVLKKINHS